MDKIRLADNGASILPKELLDFALNNSARRVRIVVPGDIHTIELALPEDAEPEEIHAAMTFEVADEIGLEAHLVRVAVAKSETYQMGGRKDLLVTAGFEEERVQGFYERCLQHDLKFDGLGALEMAILNAHAGSNSDERLLFVGRHNSFYVVPENGTFPFSVQRVSLSQKDLQNVYLEDEYFERASKVLQRSSLPIRIWTVERLGDEASENAAKLFTEDTEFKFLTFESQLLGIASHLASHDLIGSVTDGCSLVGMEDKSVSPYRAGTWICCLIIILTGCYVGMRWYTLWSNVQTADEKIAAWKVIKDERGRLENQLKQFTKSQKRSSSMQKLMQRPVLPRGFLTLLEALADNMPPYTCVTSIKELSDEHYRIFGQTEYQEGLIELNEALSNAMLKDGLRFEPEGVSQEDDLSGKEFVGMILPKTEQR